MRNLLRFFFRLLYHQFAFSYDLVAATVSLGRWRHWVLSVIPFLKGDRILEIGHGPGYLQQALLSRNLFAVGIDESAEMGRLASYNFTRSLARKIDLSKPTSQHGAYTHINLTRGLAQQLPFATESFHTLVATFPAEYIFDPQTLTEAQRVLRRDGQFVILPGATIIGRGLMDRAMALLFRITGQTPPDLADVIHERSRRPFDAAGFRVQTHELNIRSSVVLVMVATKSPASAPDSH